MASDKVPLFDSHVVNILSTSNLRDKDACDGPGGIRTLNIEKFSLELLSPAVRPLVPLAPTTAGASH